MGQKVNPNALRLGILHSWDSRWFSDRKRNYRMMLVEDIRLRQMLQSNLRAALISKVEIERSIKKIDITLHVGRPGVAIGRGGEELAKIKKAVENFFSKKKENLKIDLKIEPIKKPDLDPYLVALNIADQLVRRIPHKRAVKQAIARVMNTGAKGVKVALSGRIAGAEIGRREKYGEGTIPLSTIRENVLFAKIPAMTKSGYVGIKVWIGV
uniref:30S ribosomal protein S3 n=1 Tax=uncultured organism TaxID=155900 RepID=U3GT79_9ZZZZ|nr:30S ribosomal protein S3 [uncultured organism]